MDLTAEQITQALVRLLPRGAAWRTGEGRNTYRVLQADADELLRVYGRAEDLRAEAHPATVDELLPEWETEYGLSAGDRSLTERRLALAAKLVARGGASRQYFIDVAAALGVEITIEELQPFYVGLHGCGDPIGEVDWKFTWVVYAPAPGSAVYFDVATGVIGQPLVSYGSSELLEQTLQDIKPEHTVLVFRYTT